MYSRRADNNELVSVIIPFNEHIIFSNLTIDTYEGKTWSFKDIKDDEWELIASIIAIDKEVEGIDKALRMLGLIPGVPKVKIDELEAEREEFKDILDKKLELLCQ